MPNVLAKVMTGEIDRAVAGLEPMWDAVPEHVEDAPTARVMPFANRFGAGRLLGQALSHHARCDGVVLGIAHGGLAVAHGVAQQLGLPLDVWVVRKLRPLLDPQLVLGVLSEGASLVLDRYGLARAAMTQGQVRALVTDVAEQMADDASRYRRGRPALNLAKKTVILVDDGITTGGTLAAAIDGVRRRGATRVIVAAPVGADAAVASLQQENVEIVCLMTPARLRRVGVWYQDYRRVTDGMVMKILAASAID